MKKNKNKKIVVINSQPLVVKDNNYYIYKETGKFMVDLAKLNNDVVVFQSEIKDNLGVYLSNYNISEHNLSIVTVKRNRIKLFTYIKIFLVGMVQIRKASFTYLFYPTNIFYRLLLIISVLIGKPFGLYIRGEQGIKSKLSIFLYKKAKFLLTISSGFTDMVKTCNPNSYTIRPMISLSEEDIFRNRSFENNGIVKFLFVGRIERAKGIYELVDSVKQLIDEGISGFQVHLIGDGDDLQKVKILMKEYQIESYFVFYGVVTDKEQISRIYKECNAFVFPSHHEGFPRVLYEAMIFGLPIITTFVGSIGCLMKDQYNCLEIKPKSSNDLTEKLLYVIENYNKIAILAENGINTIKNYLENKKMSHAEQLNELIKIE